MTLKSKSSISILSFRTLNSTMENIVIPLFLKLLFIIYNGIVPTNAVSTNESSTRSSSDSISDHPGNSYKLPIENQYSVRWSQEMKSELIDLWEEAEPKREGHIQRLYELWTQKHKEYKHFNVRPKYLKEKAEEFIRTWKGPFDERFQARLRFLNEKKNFSWTPKLSDSLMECYIESGGNKSELQRLWNERNPKYKNLDAEFLNSNARRFQRKDRAQFERKLVKWDDELEAELKKIWYETLAHRDSRKHKDAIYEEWKRRKPELCGLSAKYLKHHADTLIRTDTAKRLALGEDSDLVRCQMKYMERNDNRIRWTPKLISDLLKCWCNHDLTTRERLAVWQKMQPKYANVSASHLVKTASHYSKKIMKGQLKLEKDKDVVHQSADGHQSLRQVMNPDHGTSLIGTPRPNRYLSSHHSEFQPHHEATFGGEDTSSSRVPFQSQFIEGHQQTYQLQQKDRDVVLPLVDEKQPFGRDTDSSHSTSFIGTSRSKRSLEKSLSQKSFQGQFVGGHQQTHQLQQGSLNREFHASSSKTPYLDESIHYYGTNQPQLSHSHHATIGENHYASSSNRPPSELRFLEQQVRENDDSEGYTPVRKQLKTSKSKEKSDDLDLELHLK